MSYDFYLFERRPGIDPLVTARAAQERDTEDIDPGPQLPAKEARKKSIATALINANPALEPFPLGFEEIAKSRGISVAEAKEKFRYLELNGPEDGNGIQITLFDDCASLTVPYWHQGEDAKKVFSELWGYLSVIQQAASGYEIYDPQLDCIINLSSD